MVGGNFQKPLQPLVAYGYCVFEGVACVDPSNASNGRPTYTNITFSELFVGPCVDRTEVMDKGPDYAAAPFISEFYARATCPYAGAFWGCNDRGAKLR